MKIKMLLLVSPLIFLLHCTRGGEKTGINHLKEEKSPYLQQHAENPVWWYPWGDEAFRESKRQNKPIFLSVGYSTCHWCHVMENESFTNKEVADALNRSFIAIKVDREERPDVDSIYMEAVHAMTGSGGWPMTVFLTPDKEPFFGGTYFPRETLLQILGKVDDLWRKEPGKIQEQGSKLATWMKNQKPPATTGAVGNEALVKFYESFKQSFDSVNGGRLGRPKFPPAYALRLLLRIYRRTNEKYALTMVTKTLDEMAKGGIYDHVGGGFHRYATDERWLVPHFEKMLYDQAALVNAYIEAYQVTKNKEYELVAREIIDYVLRDLSHQGGGFYSAEDADSEGSEGRFYVWKHPELKDQLPLSEFNNIKKNFDISENGNFEHGQNILSLKAGSGRLKRNASVKNALKQLFKVREKKIRPHLDDKIITSWNGLFIAALAKAGAVLNDAHYLDQARKGAHFILNRNKDQSGRLLRRWVKNESKISAYLEDYSFLIDALIELFQATSEAIWIQEAERLQALQEQLFHDPREGGYFSARADDKHLIQRKKEFEDNVIPSGTSVAVLNLLRLSAITFNQDYMKKADAILKAVPEAVRIIPTAFPQLLMAVDYKLDHAKEIAIVADKDDGDARKVRTAFFSSFMPSKVIGFSIGQNDATPLLKSKKTIQGKPTIYVCIDRVCKFPTTDLHRAIESANTYERFELKPSK
ncbi:MAG: thioredoxin domain-containing protein [Bacteriovoracia bacterium]